MSLHMLRSTRSVRRSFLAATGPSGSIMRRNPNRPCAHAHGARIGSESRYFNDAQRSCSISKRFSRGTTCGLTGAGSFDELLHVTSFRENPCAVLEVNTTASRPSIHEHRMELGEEKGSGKDWEASCSCCFSRESTRTSLFCEAIMRRFLVCGGNAPSHRAGQKSVHTCPSPARTRPRRVVARSDTARFACFPACDRVFILPVRCVDG